MSMDLLKRIWPNWDGSEDQPREAPWPTSMGDLHDREREDLRLPSEEES